MIALLIVTRDEADLLRLNLAHHLDHGVDHIAVADNMSSDDTRDVLREFGHDVTVTTLRDVSKAQLTRRKLLDQLIQRYPSLEWVGVLDTDEFWWSQDSQLPVVLADASAETVAVGFHQKLFLPTELDRTQGAVYLRRVYRTNGCGPLHTSYRRGKSFYRTSWLRGRVLTSNHWCRRVPHPQPDIAMSAIHHYMITDEDHFVQKVTRLPMTPPGKRRRLDGVRYLLGRPNNVRGPEVTAWLRLYENHGEGALREYYRTSYLLSAVDVQQHVERGDLIADPAFRDYMASCVIE